MRVGIVCLMHESNTFASGVTGLNRFQNDTLAVGNAARQRFAGTHHEVGGFLEQIEAAKHEEKRVAIWGPITGAANMTILARLFPMLANAPGIDPWEPRKLDKWAKTAWDEAGQHAARFCLMVFNSHTKWKSGKFDMHAAWTKWDKNHREAAMAWLTHPFYP
jgi:hypothetical protein